MNSTTLFKATAIGLVGGLVFVLILLLASEHSRAEKLEATQKRICLNQRFHIESILRGTAVGDLVTRVRADITDVVISQACLGSEVPVDFEDAEACWIGKSQQTCFLEPLQRLLLLYKQRYP